MNNQLIAIKSAYIQWLEYGDDFIQQLTAIKQEGLCLIVEYQDATRGYNYAKIFPLRIFINMPEILSVVLPHVAEQYKWPVKIAIPDDLITVIARSIATDTFIDETDNSPSDFCRIWNPFEKS